MGSDTVLMVIERRTRLLRTARWIPYVLVVLLAMAHLIFELPRAMTPFEGSIPFLYEKTFNALLCLLVVGSVVAKGTARSVLALTGCASLFSTGLFAFFRRVHEYPIRPPDGGPIYLNVWTDIAVLGLFFLVMVIEAAILIRSRTNQP